MQSASFRTLTLAAALLACGASHAGVITYYFQDSNGRSGSFSFDDANTTTVSDPFGAGGTAYAAISFDFGGTSVSTPLLNLYNDYFNGSEYVYFIDGSNPFGFNLSFTSAGHGLLSSSAASEMAGRSLADFSGGGVSPSGSALTYFSTSPLPSAVPEPQSYALLLAGLAATGLARRRAVKR